MKLLPEVLNGCIVKSMMSFWSFCVVGASLLSMAEHCKLIKILFGSTSASSHIFYFKLMAKKRFLARSQSS